MNITDDERKALNAIGDAYNAICKLPVLHPADLPETVVDIHNLQNRILARPVYRVLHNIIEKAT